MTEPLLAPTVSPAPLRRARGSRHRLGRRWTAVVACFGLCLAASGPAIAAPTAEDDANAGKFFRDGLEQRDAGHKAAAIELLRRAHALQVSPRPGLEAGKLLAEQGDLLEARTVLREVVRLPEYRETSKTRAAREEAAALIEQLEHRIPSLVLTVRDAPASASYQVWLDGREFKTALLGAIWQVNPGTHVAEVRVGDAVAAHTEVTVRESEQRSVELDGSKIPLRAPGVAGTDGSTTGAPGPSPVVPPPPPSAPATSAWRIAGWAGLAVGAVAAGVGGGLMIKAKSDYDGMDDVCADNACTGEAETQRRNDARTRANVAGAVFAGGLVVAGAGLALVFFAPSGRRADKPSVSLVPTLGGAMLTGSF